LESLYNAGLDGTGVTIAVVGQTAISLTDTQSFRAAAQLPAKDPALLLVSGTGTSTHCTGDEVEADLDVEWSGAVAKGANVIYVYTGVDSGKTCATTSKSVWDALEDAVANNRAPVISTSYGFCESGLGAAFVQQELEPLAQQANSQGQSISAASGDDGAADCEQPVGTNPITSATQGPAVDSPASVPEVTGVGGTEFTGDVAGAVSGNDAGADLPYWNGTSGGVDLLNSALEYIPETAWNDSAADIASGGGISATGGGVSIMFAKPSWQTGTGVPAANHRYVPDIAFNASADHDPYLVCSQDFYTGDSPEPTSCVTS
jgi:subtilase family serine protease